MQYFCTYIMDYSEEHSGMEGRRGNYYSFILANASPDYRCFEPYSNVIKQTAKTMHYYFIERTLAYGVQVWPIVELFYLSISNIRLLYEGGGEGVAGSKDYVTSLQAYMTWVGTGHAIIVHGQLLRLYRPKRLFLQTLETLFNCF